MAAGKEAPAPLSLLVLLLGLVVSPPLQEARVTLAVKPTMAARVLMV